MPEGDTVFRTAVALREALVGKTLTRCDVRVPRYATVDLGGWDTHEGQGTAGSGYHYYQNKISSEHDDKFHNIMPFTIM